jgi:hypothetical protein
MEQPKKYNQPCPCWKSLKLSMGNHNFARKFCSSQIINHQASGRLCCRVSPRFCVACPLAWLSPQPWPPRWEPGQWIPRQGTPGPSLWRAADAHPCPAGCPSGHCPSHLQLGPGWSPGVYPAEIAGSSSSFSPPAECLRSSRPGQTWWPWRLSTVPVGSSICPWRWRSPWAWDGQG